MVALQAHGPRCGLQPGTHGQGVAAAPPASVSQASLQKGHRDKKIKSSHLEGPQGCVWAPAEDQPLHKCPKSKQQSTAYLRHRLGGGESDRERDREDEDEDEDEDSLAPSELELKERLARLRPALQLSPGGLGESWALR